MQNKFIIRDRCILLLLLYIFTFGTYSLFGNNRSVNLFELVDFQHRVKGLVTDSNGVPIPGVNVEIKGTSQGTFTDNDGNFFVDAAPTDVLVLSYIGFKTLEVTIGISTELSLTLQENVTNLDAVTVNAGYYTVKERERTGSIAKVTAEEIELQPIVSPLQSLEGRMAGVEVEQGSGITGLAPTIRIRGQNSLRNNRKDNGNYPLFIIDGVPVNSAPIQSHGSLTTITGLDPLSTLNLNNIKSIEVLKDADATAIYGSRGANGVVLITSKKGKLNQGKSSLELNIYSGISEVSNKMSLLNTKQYISMRKQAFENDRVIPTETNAPDLMVWDQNRYTDWQDVLFGGSAFANSINMAISGGNANTSYRIGGSYNKLGSVFPGDFDYNKLTANMNFSHRSDNNRFQLDLSVNYGADNNKVFNGSNFVKYALSVPPNAPPIYKVDGSLNWENWTVDNPLAVLEQPQDITTDNLLANLNISYGIVKGLKFKISTGYSKLDNDDIIKYYKERYNPNRWERIKLGVNQNYSKRRSWIIEPQIIFNQTYGEINIDALIGGTFQDNKNSFLSMTANGYPDKSLMSNLNAAEEVRITNDANIHYRYAALFGRLGLNWSNKYFLNITGRRDGSSKFGPNRRFSNFWAVGGAWIFSKEKSIKNNLTFLSFGKLRGSYGTTGSDQIPDYGYLDTYEATEGVGGLYPTQLFNPNYSWEVNKKLEASLQLGFLNDYISMEVIWYRNRSSNQLVGYPLPAITGFSSVQANLPATVQNSGWEILLNTMNLSNKNFSWQTSINMTIPKNKLLKFDNIDDTSYATQYRVGHPLDISFFYQYAGINQETGFYQIVDANKDGRYNIDDRVIIKDMGRKYYVGISNHVRYKGFSLQFLFEFVKQLNGSYIFSATPPGFSGNKPVEFLESWERPGDNENIQKASQSFLAIDPFYNTANSTKGIEDASFLRLKNISLSYRLPQNILEKLNVKSGQIYVRAQNLLTITPYKGLDPQGGMGVVPPLRTITCGIKVTL